MSVLSWRLEMYFLKQVMIITVGIIMVFLSACTAGGVGAPSATDAILENPPQAVLDAQAWLANEMGITADQVQLVGIEQTDWPDSCLGLGGPEESCAAVVTPGWEVIVEVNGQQYEVRASEDGSAIRLVQS
jgi:hypothetical protein